MKCLYFENNTHGWGTPFINYLFIDFSSCQFCLKVYTEISREPSYQLLSGLLLGSFSLHFPVWLLFWFGLVLRVMFHFNENNKSIALKNFKIKVEVLATAPWIHSPPAPGSVLPVLTHYFCTCAPETPWLGQGQVLTFTPSAAIFSHETLGCMGRDPVWPALCQLHLSLVNQLPGTGMAISRRLYPGFVPWGFFDPRAKLHGNKQESWAGSGHHSRPIKTAWWPQLWY